MKKVFFILIIVFAAGLVFGADDSDTGTEKKKKSAQEYISDLSAANNEQTIVEAAEWLGKEKKKDAVPALINLLADNRENVRIESIVALGLIGDESSVDSVNNALLNDESAEVRYAALLAAIRIGSKKSLEALQQSKERETDPFMKDLLDKMEDKMKGK